MDISSIHTIYTPLYMKFDTSERLKNAQVFLAHYTLVSVMQKIIDTAEVWFSNPLFMSDLEELRFGLFEGARIFSEPQILKRASGSDARSLMLEAAFTTYHTGYQ